MCLVSDVQVVVKREEGKGLQIVKQRVWKQRRANLKIVNKNVQILMFVKY